MFRTADRPHFSVSYPNQICKPFHQIVTFSWSLESFRSLESLRSLESGVWSQRHPKRHPTRSKTLSKTSSNIIQIVTQNVIQNVIRHPKPHPNCHSNRHPSSKTSSVIQNYILTVIQIVIRHPKRHPNHRLKRNPASSTPYKPVSMDYVLDDGGNSELMLKDVIYDSDGMGITSHELRMRKLNSNVLMICDRRQIHSFNVLVQREKKQISS